MAKPTLLQAVKEKYDTIGGGLPTLWLDEVPEGGSAAGYPRSILRDGGQIPEPEIEADGTVASSLHSFSLEVIVENSSDDAETLGLLLLQAFTPASVALTFDAGATLEHDKRTHRTQALEERSPADKPLYSFLVNYVCRYGPNY